MSKLELVQLHGEAPRSGSSLDDALNFIEAALQILDASSAPGDIGAHLDLGLHRLREEIGRVGPLNDRGPNDCVEERGQ